MVENRQARSPAPHWRPPELERRERQIQIGAQQREIHRVPRFVERGNLFRAHANKFSAIASGGRETGERKPRQAVGDHLRRRDRKLEGLSREARGASAVTRSWHNVARRGKGAERTKASVAGQVAERLGSMLLLGNCGSASLTGSQATLCSSQISLAGANRSGKSKLAVVTSIVVGVSSC